MFKNPLKYQKGGQINQDQQKLLAAFIEWLPKRVKEFQGMQPEAIAQALDGMSKTEEGRKQVEQLMTQFQQEMQNGQSQAFRQGGKIHDFICKHRRGGKADCGCGVEKHQQSPNKRVGRGVISEKHTYDDNGGYSGTFSSTGIYGDINGQPAAAPGIYDTLGRYLPKGMTESSGPFWVVGQGGSNLGGVYFDNSGYGRTQLDEESARKAAEKIMSRGAYNYKLYPSKGDGGKLDNSSKINQTNQSVGYSPYHAEIPAAQVSAPTKTYTAEIPAAQVKASVIKNQNPAGPMPEPDFGTVQQGKPRSKISKVVDNNSKLRNFISGTKNFVSSPMVRWPAAGAAAYAGWKLGGLPFFQETGEIAPFLAKPLFSVLSQMRPKFMLDTMNPLKQSTSDQNWHNTFWAIPEDNVMDKNNL